MSEHRGTWECLSPQPHVVPDMLRHALRSAFRSTPGGSRTLPPQHQRFEETAKFIPRSATYSIFGAKSENKCNDLNQVDRLIL